MKYNKLKSRKVKLNRNFFIIQFIIACIILLIFKGDVLKSAITFVIELSVYLYASKYLFMSLSKHNKNPSKYRNMDHNVEREIESIEKRSKIGEKKKNYNWLVTENKSSANTGEIKIDNSSNTRKEKIAEKKEFVPYRSPFESVIKNSANIDNNNESDNIPEDNGRDLKVIDVIRKNEIAEKNVFVPYRSPFESVIKNSANIDNIDVTRKNEIVNEVMPEEIDQNENSDFIIAEEAVSSGEADCCNMEDDNDECSIINEGELDQDIIDSTMDMEDSSFCDDIEELETLVPEEIIKDKYLDNKSRILEAFKSNRFTGRVIDKPKSEPNSGIVCKGTPQIERIPVPVELLNKIEFKEDDEETFANIDFNAKKLIETLSSFGVGVKVLNVCKGPSVTRYELQPNAGVKVSKIINLADDIALNLAAMGVRIEAPIPGKAAVGIEIPNKSVEPVFLRDVIESEQFQSHASKLAFAVGKDIAGNIVISDIGSMPHLLIAGATGSGKSVCINTLIISLLYKASPSEVKLLMVDPKVVELGIYNGIPHLLIPVVTDPKKAAGALSWAVVEMTNRYRLFAENNVRDLKGYNAVVKEKGNGEMLPQIVIIIDELADLMMVAPNDVEDCICRLAQMARAAGMHLVIATQRPSVDVITGVIKANIPSRISFAVSSQIDSRTILDMAGAEKLLGRGDMLFYPLGQPKPVRVQGGFISDKEVENIVTHIKQKQIAEYNQEIIQKLDSQNDAQKVDTSGDDELLPQAIEMVIDMGQASASLIQRKFKVGYSRAARILDQMETWGVVSGSDGSKPRQILVTRSEWEELNA
ncbi:MAG TPA: DNA translocase FtsK [Clostridia bacterium]